MLSHLAGCAPRAWPEPFAALRGKLRRRVASYRADSTLLPNAARSAKMSNLVIFPDNQGFVDGSADFIAGLATQAIAERGRFTIALSGGSTPRAVYARLATAGYKERIDWFKAHVFFGDERCVPPDDSRSNYRMAREALLDHVPLPADKIYRIRGEDDPALAALMYEQQVQSLFRTALPPAFDLILLGMGDNGHTASLFPGTAALR